MTYDEAIEWTTAHRDQIAKSAERGGAKATAIVGLHRMLVRCAEPAAAGLFTAAVEDYCRSESAKSKK